MKEIGDSSFPLSLINKLMELSVKILHKIFLFYVYVLEVIYDLLVGACSGILDVIFACH